MLVKKTKKDIYEITCASAEALLSDLAKSGITVWDVHIPAPLTVRFCASQKDRPEIDKIIHKFGASGKVRRGYGIDWVINRIKRRKLFAFSVFLLFLLSMLLPAKVLFVQVTGNDSIPDRMIIEAAKKCGIDFWARRKEVRSEKMKNALLFEMPQLQWAGINTYGCTAVISVKERSDNASNTEAEGVYSIIAVRDGIVKECTVKHGNPLCKPGQAVKTGEVLVSGYTDCGLYIQATRAEGEITAETFRSVSVLTTKNVMSRQEKIRTERRYSLIIGKKLINLFKGSGILDSTCVKINEIYPLTLPGGFQLPLSLVCETVSYYDPVIETADLDEDHTWLSNCAEKYLIDSMVAGKILHGNVDIVAQEDVIKLTGLYFCEEMIGKLHKEEYLNTYVQNR